MLLIFLFPAVQVSGTEFVSISEPVKLMCNATGKPDPPHDVEWFKGGHKINSNAMNGVLITKKIETKMLISVLVISGSRKEDEGDYVCRSSNMDHGSIKVHVLTGMYHRGDATICRQTTIFLLNYINLIILKFILFLI